MTRRPYPRTRRAAFLRGMVAAGVGLVAIEERSARDAQATDIVPGLCVDSVQTILDTALIAERLAATFYYTGLTSPAVMRHPRLGGSSTDPNHPGLPPNGHPNNVKFLQAALDAEVKHAALLTQAGAGAPYTHFYFPAITFQKLGHPDGTDTFLHVLETLETAFANAYSVAVVQLLTHKRADLAQVTAQIAGVEAEHRTLGRAIARSLPANNITLERVSVACVSEVGQELAPFLTGKGFATGAATGPIALPSKAQTDRVIGRYQSHVVTHFL